MHAQKRLLALSLTTALGCALLATGMPERAEANTARTYFPESPYEMRRRDVGASTAAPRRLTNPQILYQDAQGTSTHSSGMVTEGVQTAAPLPSAPMNVAPVAPLYPNRGIDPVSMDEFQPATAAAPVQSAPTQFWDEDAPVAAQPAEEAESLWDYMTGESTASAPSIQPSTHEKMMMELPPPPSMPGAPATISSAPKAATMSPFQSSATTPAVNLDISSAPAAQMPEPVRSTANSLSAESREMIAHIPESLEPEVEKSSKVSLSRLDPDVMNILQASEEATVSDSSGAVGVAVKRPSYDVNYELEKAYNAVLSGDIEEAIDIYKEALSISPRNKTGLFGLATTYHRIGSLDNARALYARLLEIEPDHTEGLNNFLALVAEESPEEALPELQVLAAKHPSFSPILAQLGVLYQQLGDYNQARSNMMQAVRLSPENMTYRYNLAIMLDQQGAYAEAANVYRYLIGVSQRGVQIPADASTLQDRLTYILSQLS